MVEVSVVARTRIILSWSCDGNLLNMFLFAGLKVYWVDLKGIFSEVFGKFYDYISIILNGQHTGYCDSKLLQIISFGSSNINISI